MYFDGHMRKRIPAEKQNKTEKQRKIIVILLRDKPISHKGNIVPLLFRFRN